MKYEHTKERDDYIAAHGKIVLNACPGSGKTTTVAFKITKLLENWENEHGKYSGIACLSFTNGAKDEINDKIFKFSGTPLKFPHIVSTIDSFINQYITLQFYKVLLPTYTKRPIILDDASFLDKMFFSFKLNNKLIQYSYSPSEIDLQLDNTFSWKNKTVKLTNNDKTIFEKYCNAVKKYQFSNGLLKNSDSTYAALNILKKNPEVAKLLVKRFPYVILDEAQDTSELQDAIFEKLIENGLENVEYIGDPYQSLYEWRNAQPDLFWKKCSSVGWQKYSLTHCRRSTQKIIDCYSVLRLATDAKIASGNSNTILPVRVISYNNKDQLLIRYEELSKSYATSEKNIVVRGTSLQKEFDALPAGSSYWNMTPCIPLHIINAKELFGSNKIKKAIDCLRKYMYILYDKTAYGDNARREEIEKEIFSSPGINGKLLDLIANIPSFNSNLLDWTNSCQEMCKTIFGLAEIPDFHIKKGKYCPTHKIQMTELFKPTKNYGLVNTIHSVKGKNYDSVLLILGNNSSGQSISFSDITKPDKLPNEKQRMLYVAMSRPRYQLIIAVPKLAKVSAEDVKGIFGNSAEFEAI